MEGCCSPRGLGVQMVPASEGGRNGQSVGRMVPRRGPGMQLERWCPTPAITLQGRRCTPDPHLAPVAGTKGGGRALSAAARLMMLVAGGRQLNEGSRRHPPDLVCVSARVRDLTTPVFGCCSSDVPRDVDHGRLSAAATGAIGRAGATRFLNHIPVPEAENRLSLRNRS